MIVSRAENLLTMRLPNSLSTVIFCSFAQLATHVTLSSGNWQECVSHANEKMKHSYHCSAPLTKHFQREWTQQLPWGHFFPCVKETNMNYPRTLLPPGARFVNIAVYLSTCCSLNSFQTLHSVTTLQKCEGAWLNLNFIFIFNVIVFVLTWNLKQQLCWNPLQLDRQQKADKNEKKNVNINCNLLGCSLYFNCKQLFS